MNTLARLMRYLFGLQALAGLIGLVGVVCFPLILMTRDADPDAQAITLRFMAVHGTAALWDVAPGIAWWKLRKGKPDAAGWAIAASLLCLPLPFTGILEDAQLHAHCWVIFATLAHIPHQFLELAVGITGLAVFLRPEAIQLAAEPKPERIQGDGASKFWEWALAVLLPAGAVVAFIWWPHWAASRSLETPRVPVMIGIVVLALWIEIAFHEFGHYVAGSLCGFKLRRFHVRFFWWSVRNGKWTFEFSRKVSVGGLVGMAPLNLQDFHRRTAILSAGGPLASLTMSVASLAVLYTTPIGAAPFWWCLLATITTVSFLSFLANLTPQRTKHFYSDGAQLFQLLSHGPWGKVRLALGMAGVSVLGEIRPRDWDIGLIQEAADFLKTGRQGMFLRLLASHYYLDSGRIEEAVVHTKAAEGLFQPEAVLKPGDVYAEFVFVNALYARDLPAAEAWWDKLQALKKLDYDADYWRARSSILWLRGDLENALRAWETGNEKAQKLPSCGMYDFTRSQFAELRKALDQGVPQSSARTENPVGVT